jgi:hypothetical protein
VDSKPKNSTKRSRKRKKRSAEEVYNALPADLRARVPLKLVAELIDESTVVFEELKRGPWPGDDSLEEKKSD